MWRRDCTLALGAASSPSLLRLGDPAHRSSQLTRVWILAGRRIGLVWRRLPGQVALSAASSESFATAGAWFGWFAAVQVQPPKNTLF